MFCTIWYHLCNLKNVKNTHGGVLKPAIFLNNKTLPWVFFTFFNLCNWYQIVQRITWTFVVYFKMGITKPCTHLHPVPSTIPQLISTSTQLHPPPPSSFQPPTSSMQHPQQYLDQNISRNWAISPNLGQKIKICPFWLQIGTHVTLEVLIPNQHLGF